MSETIKVALYGNWCTRKTLQIHNLIEAVGKDRVWVISCDGGLETISGELDESHVKPVDTKDDLERMWAGFMKAGQDGKIPEGSWVCVDGFTRIAEKVEDAYKDGLDECAKYVVTGGVAAVPPHLRQYLRFVSKEGAPDNQKVYGPIGTDVKIMIDQWISTVKYANLFLTMHEQLSSGDRSGVPPFIPKLPGGIARTHIMGSFDYVMRAVVQGGKAVAQLDPERMNTGYWSRTRENGSRVKNMPKEIADFNLAEFADRVRGEGWGK